MQIAECRMREGLYRCVGRLFAPTLALRSGVILHSAFIILHFYVSASFSAFASSWPRGRSASPLVIAFT